MVCLLLIPENAWWVFFISTELSSLESTTVEMCGSWSVSVGWWWPLPLALEIIEDSFRRVCYV